MLVLVVKTAHDLWRTIYNCIIVGVYECVCVCLCVCIYIYIYIYKSIYIYGASWVDMLVKIPPAMPETPVPFLGWEVSLEKR